MLSADLPFLNAECLLMSRDDINMVIVMRAMGMESDQEIMELIGSEPGVGALLASTVQEAKAAGIYTKQQALEYMGRLHNDRSLEATMILTSLTRAYLS